MGSTKQILIQTHENEFLKYFRQDAAIKAALKASQGRLRQHVTRVLNMKYSPTLSFTMSTTRDRELKMAKLFESIQDDVKRP